ncbi:MAG: thermonuclease family protein [Candidatus Omnitrophica bacterium]|nr:thermonuclease family protein [Candidatus Omnitrophota bacterium]
MNKKRFIAVLAIAAAVFLAQNKTSQSLKIDVPFGKPYDYDHILITKVIDGDTLRLENGERVRLIGIDTPEVHPNNKLYRDVKRTGQDADSIMEMGKAALEFTKKLAEGKNVSLEFDVQKRDRYERLLAYVYVLGSDKKKNTAIFLNAEIIKAGYAGLMTIPPDVKYTDLFQKLYKEARKNKRGLWK